MRNNDSEKKNWFYEFITGFSELFADEGRVGILGVIGFVFGWLIYSDYSNGKGSGWLILVFISTCVLAFSVFYIYKNNDIYHSIYDSKGIYVDIDKIIIIIGVVSLIIFIVGLVKNKFLAFVILPCIYVFFYVLPFVFMILEVFLEFLASKKEKKFEKTIEILFSAIVENDKNAVTKILADGFDVNKEFQGETPLLCAMKNNRIGMISFLLENGAKVEPEVFSKAIERRNEEILSMFIAAGADINAEYYYSFDEYHSYTPLIYAIEENKVDLVTYLIDNGADINKKVYTKCGDMSPLEYACFLGKKVDKDLLSCLVVKGANIKEEDEDGQTLLFNCYDKDTITNLIKNGADINHRDSNGMTPLEFAIEDRNYNLVSALIDNGVKINNDLLIDVIDNAIAFKVEDRGNSDYVLSKYDNARKEFIQLISVLISSGIDINHSSKYEGKTPLGYVLSVKYFFVRDEIVQLLLDKGTDVNKADINGVTPLMEAIKNGSSWCSKFLQMGVNPNCKSKDGSTSLLFAIEMASEQDVSDLINYGADVNCANNEGDTPLICAISNMYKTVRTYKDIIDRLIDNGADTNCVNKRGETPLLCAVKMYCDYNKEISERSGKVYVPYTSPSFSESYKNFLSNPNSVQNEYDDFIRNQELNALRSREFRETIDLEEKAIMDFFEKLISSGANVNFVNEYGETALSRALKFNCREIIEFLKSVGAVPNPVKSYSEQKIKITESSTAFTTALVSLSKVIALNGTDIFKTENKQQFTGLISDFLPQNNELYPILKQALQSDFTELLLDATDKDEDKKSEAFDNAVSKIMNGTKMTKADANLAARLVVLSLS